MIVFFKTIVFFDDSDNHMHKRFCYPFVNMVWVNSSSSLERSFVDALNK